MVIWQVIWMFYNAIYVWKWRLFKTCDNFTVWLDSYPLELISNSIPINIECCATHQCRILVSLKYDIKLTTCYIISDILSEIIKDVCTWMVIIRLTKVLRNHTYVCFPNMPNQTFSQARLQKNKPKTWIRRNEVCQIYGQKWPDLWPNEIVGMAMAIVAIPDITSIEGVELTQKLKQT